MRGHLVILEVNSVIIGSVQWHELGLLPGEHIKEVVVLWRDHFGYELPFICRERFGMQCSCWGRVVTDGPKVGLLGRQSGWSDIEHEDVISLVYKFFKGCGPNDADRGGCVPGEQYGIHLLGERKGIVGIQREGVCGIL